MKEYWYIFVFAIMCAVFSKQIDKAFARAIKDSKKRAAVYCVAGAVFLGIIGFFIYKAVNVISGDFAILIASAPCVLFVVAAILGFMFVKQRQKKAD